MTRFHKRLMAILASVLAMFTITPMAFADMNGIDVSGWQSSNVTCQVAGDFAIVKATGGLSYTNPKWAAQAACTVNSGKELGLYHYAGDYHSGNATAEADHFVNVVSPYLGRAVLVLDWEMGGNANWLNGNWVREFVNRVHARTGVWPMVYTSAAYVWNIPSDVRKNCGLWVAQYANMNATGYQSRPWNYGAAGEAMRQYTSSGYVSGVGPLDLNVFRGDRAAWRKYANPSANGTFAPKPTPAPQPAPSVDYNALATAVIRGDYGNDPYRRQRLGANYDKVMAIVNARLRGQSAPTYTRPSASTRGLSVTVRSGDTISAIAARNNAFPLSAWRVPSGNINRIYPGQTVTYNGGGSVATASNAPNYGRSYVVRAGDTLSGIAARYGISFTRIHGYRSGNPALIYPGEVLRW